MLLFLVVNLFCVLCVAEPSAQALYTKCVKVCAAKAECRELGSSLPRPILSENCVDVCENQCLDIWFQAQPPMKYQGRWPLLRLWGMYDPVSVLACAINFLVNLFYLWKVVRFVPPLCSRKKFHIILACHAIAYYGVSTLYHVKLRDSVSDIEQCLQVFLFFFWTIVAFIRVIEGSNKTNLLVCGFYFFVSWGYFVLLGNEVVVNKIACAVSASFGTILWTVGWYWLTGREPRHKPFSWRLIWALQIAWMFSLFELADVAPIYNGLVDGHAIWHFGTIVPWIWYWKAIMLDELVIFQHQKSISEV